MTHYRKPSIEALQEIVDQKQAVRFKYEGRSKSVLVDLFTASAIMAVYRHLNEKNQGQVRELIKTPQGLGRMAHIAFERTR